MCGIPQRSSTYDSVRRTLSQNSIVTTVVLSREGGTNVVGSRRGSCSVDIFIRGWTMWIALKLGSARFGLSKVHGNLASASFHPNSDLKIPKLGDIAQGYLLYHSSRVIELSFSPLPGLDGVRSKGSGESLNSLAGISRSPRLDSR